MSGGLTFEAIVRERREAADGVIVLDLERPGGVLPHWSPGAHIDVVLPGGVERQYSLCGSPSERGTCASACCASARARCGCTRTRTPHRAACAGAREPLPLRPHRRPLVRLRRRGHRHHPDRPDDRGRRRRGRRVDTAVCGPVAETMAFVTELVERYGDRVQVFAADEGTRLDLDARLGTPASRTVVYACGPARLLESLDATMSGWPRGSLHVERFEAKVLGPRCGPSRSRSTS